MNESAHVFTYEQHKAVIADIELMQYSVKTNQFSTKWCSDLAKVRHSLLYSLLMNCAHSIAQQQIQTMMMIFLLQKLFMLCKLTKSNMSISLHLFEHIIYRSGLLIRNNHGKSCWKIGSRISIWILSWKLLLVLMSSSSKVGKKKKKKKKRVGGF